MGTNLRSAVDSVNRFPWLFCLANGKSMFATAYCKFAIAGLSPPMSVVIVPRLGKDAKVRNFPETVA